MTVAEMIIGVNLGVQRVDSNAYDSLLEDEILYYLNRAQEEYIEQQYVLIRGKHGDENIQIYEASQKAIENLRTIIITELAGNGNISAVSNYPNAKSYDLTDLTDTFFFYIRSQSQVSNGGAWVINDLINQDKIEKYIQTRNNTPIFRNFPVLLEGNNMYVFYDTQTNSDVYDLSITFIKSPDKLVTATPGAGETNTCELPIHTHQDIVNYTVSLILSDLSGGKQ